MSKAPVKELWLFDEVYRVGLNLVVCSDRKQWDKWLDDIKYSEDEEARIAHNLVDGAYYRVTPDNNTAGNNTNVIFLRTKNISVLTHELIHLIFKTFDEKGVPVRLENDEAFAYYLEMWLNKVRKAW